MRRVYQENKYLRHSLSVARREAKRRVQRRRRTKHNSRYGHKRITRTAAQIARRMGATQFRLPQKFSFISNPEQVIWAIGELEKMVENEQPVFVNMESVKEIDYAAISALLSVMYVFKSEGVDFDGNFPRTREANLAMRGSGFQYHLFANTGNKAKYKIGEANQMLTQAGKELDPGLITSVIEDASRTVWDEPRRSQGLNRVIIELIDNTHDHAADLKRGTERWWLSINHDKENKKVSFVFLDYGVGIFTSLAKKPSSSALGRRMKKLQQKWGLAASDEYLRSILTVPIRNTSSDRKGRGNGIYYIGQTVVRNQIGNLHIISNNAYGDIEKKEFRKLSQNFNGTLFYWELGYTNANAPWILN